MRIPASRTILNRRTFLKSGAVSIALPLLNAMLPRGLRADAAALALAPKRLLLVARNLGLHAPFFFPETAGPDYESTRYLSLLEEHRVPSQFFRACHTLATSRTTAKKASLPE